MLPLLRVKHKDWEFSFRLDQAEKEAAALPVTTATPEFEPTPEETSKFERIAEISPRAAIREVRSDIEEALISLTKSANLLPQRPQSILGLTRLLRNREILDHQTSALLDDLRAVGNQASHPSDKDFTKAEALRYRALADQVIRRLSAMEAKLGQNR